MFRIGLYYFSSPNHPSRTIEKAFTSPPAAKQQTAPQIQTKAQTKIYSELGNQREQQQQQQQQQRYHQRFSILY